MAEKGPCPGLDASLRSEDLLSDMEPLPLSAPATPAQPFGSPRPPHSFSLHLQSVAGPAGGTVAVPSRAREQRTAQSRWACSLAHPGERVSLSRGPLSPAGGALGLGTVERKDDDDSFESDSTTALLAARPLQELSPPGSVCGLEELFPRYASLRLGTPPEPVPATEPVLLKEALAKERARRKAVCLLCVYMCVYLERRGAG
ncbi:Centrobin [Chelonia mydas]|uniref:Centrobin n=1 Tax=Chelonia mydas TaxID=8469 RepID=M7BC22_CHEMY|nr:Centrobin [Chelonia mydas]